jgi:hypothetical protein
MECGGVETFTKSSWQKDGVDMAAQIETRQDATGPESAERVIEVHEDFGGDAGLESLR